MAQQKMLEDKNNCKSSLFFQKAHQGTEVKQYTTCQIT